MSQITLPLSLTVTEIKTWLRRHYASWYDDHYPEMRALSDHLLQFPDAAEHRKCIEACVSLLKEEFSSGLMEVSLRDVLIDVLSLLFDREEFTEEELRWLEEALVEDFERMCPYTTLSMQTLRYVNYRRQIVKSLSRLRLGTEAHWKSIADYRFTEHGGYDHYRVEAFYALAHQVFHGATFDENFMAMLLLEWFRYTTRNQKELTSEFLTKTRDDLVDWEVLSEPPSDAFGTWALKARLLLTDEVELRRFDTLMSGLRVSYVL